MPAYNPADPMFYNLPVYGAAMEGPPVYSEAFDLGTAGPYTEVRGRFSFKVSTEKEFSILITKILNMKTIFWTMMYRL